MGIDFHTHGDSISHPVQFSNPTRLSDDTSPLTPTFIFLFVRSCRFNSHSTKTQHAIPSPIPSTPSCRRKSTTTTTHARLAPHNTRPSPHCRSHTLGSICLASLPTLFVLDIWWTIWVWAGATETEESGYRRKWTWHMASGCKVKVEKRL